ncbi:MAG TPA: GNAT family N-acetyltransferase [Longimicrobium sp.]|nr:GNAT family N-acetyltransferase [Longimicrobium sp.]
MPITTPESDDEILATWDVMAQLRPHIPRGDYVSIVRGMMGSDGYRLAALEDGGTVRAVAGYRFMHMLYCGKLLYVDDLVSDETVRSRGYGKELLDWLKAEARDNGCSELQLISRVTREQAHRFYFREGLSIECFEFRIKL